MIREDFAGDTKGVALAVTRCVPKCDEPVNVRSRSPGTAGTDETREPSRELLLDSTCLSLVQLGTSCSERPGDWPTDICRGRL